MNILEILADSIWWLLYNSAGGVITFLEINYSLVSLIINCIQIIINISIDFLSSVFEILKCYYYDFLTFSSELALATGFILSLVITFLSKRLEELTYFSYCLTDCMNVIVENILIITSDATSLLYELLQNVLYFLAVIFHAILFLLQLGPNVLIFIYESILNSCMQAFILLQFSLHLLWENVCVIPFEGKNIICNIPLKAYLGIILCISIFHTRITVKKYLVNLTNNLFHHCSMLWFNLIPKTIANLILFFKKCKKHVFTEETELSATPFLKKMIKKSLLAFQHSHNVLKYVFKVPLSRVTEELSDYELQELEKKLCAEKERHLCVICHDRDRSILLYPCRHMCMCEECTSAIQAAYQGCPLCRQHILDTIKVYS